LRKSCTEQDSIDSKFQGLAVSGGALNSTHSLQGLAVAYGSSGNSKLWCQWQF